ncbi:unnamed protein product [Amoebophrya sp. A120]|nr:unnamed protein product [Amoebophrya sp. A120]|eukprot:GSA120T00002030001.1
MSRTKVKRVAAMRSSIRRTHFAILIYKGTKAMASSMANMARYCFFTSYFAATYMIIGARTLAERAGVFTAERLSQRKIELSTIMNALPEFASRRNLRRRRRLVYQTGIITYHTLLLALVVALIAVVVANIFGHADKAPQQKGAGPGANLSASVRDQGTSSGNVTEEYIAGDPENGTRKAIQSALDEGRWARTELSGNVTDHNFAAHHDRRAREGALDPMSQKLLEEEPFLVPQEPSVASSGSGGRVSCRQPENSSDDSHSSNRTSLLGPSTNTTCADAEPLSPHTGDDLGTIAAPGELDAKAPPVMHLSGACLAMDAKDREACEAPGSPWEHNELLCKAKSLCRWVSASTNGTAPAAFPEADNQVDHCRAKNNTPDRAKECEDANAQHYSDPGLCNALPGCQFGRPWPSAATPLEGADLLRDGLEQRSSLHAAKETGAGLPDATVDIRDAGAASMPGIDAKLAKASSVSKNATSSKRRKREWIFEGEEDFDSDKEDGMVHRLAGQVVDWLQSWDQVLQELGDPKRGGNSSNSSNTSLELGEEDVLEEATDGASRPRKFKKGPVEEL